MMGRIRNHLKSWRVFGLLWACWCIPVAVLAAEPSALGAAANQYRLGPGDVIRISVYQSPDLSLESRVGESGTITYPLLGSVQLSGLTINEAENLIATNLKQGGYIRNPQVLIAITQIRSNQISVLGMVGRSGRLPLDMAGMRLTEVLAMAGGLAGDAASETLVLTGTRNGQPHRAEINLPAIFEPGGQAKDVIVMPGDVLWVDRAPQVYFYGEINRPGQMRLGRGMTVMQALAAAGGVSQRGTLKGLRISRRDATGAVVSIEPEMNDLLRDGDVVYVRESLF